MYLFSYLLRVYDNHASQQRSGKDPIMLNLLSFIAAQSNQSSCVNQIKHTLLPLNFLTSSFRGIELRCCEVQRGTRKRREKREEHRERLIACNPLLRWQRLHLQARSGNVSATLCCLEQTHRAHQGLINQMKALGNAPKPLFKAHTITFCSTHTTLATRKPKLYVEARSGFYLPASLCHGFIASSGCACNAEVQAPKTKETRSEQGRSGLIMSDRALR